MAANAVCCWHGQEYTEKAVMVSFMGWMPSPPSLAFLPAYIIINHLVEGPYILAMSQGNPCWEMHPLNPNKTYTRCGLVQHIMSMLHSIGSVTFI